MMHRSNVLLRMINSFVNGMIVLVLVVVGLYAVYALWDNHQIYSAAEDVQADMIQLKPEIEEGGGASFEELLNVNPDVCAWVTLDGTHIDYPILQGETNLTYINTDVYRNFALAGSIFLDSRNHDDFSDGYSLLYGHHMENGGMFGDLDLYKDKLFLEQHTTGMLLLPDKTYDLEVFACCVTNASDENLFVPDHWETNVDGLFAYAEKKAVSCCDAMDEIVDMEHPQILALSTCDTDFANARTVVLAAMEPHDEDREVD